MATPFALRDRNLANALAGATCTDEELPAQSGTFRALKDIGPVGQPRAVAELAGTVAILCPDERDRRALHQWFSGTRMRWALLCDVEALSVFAAASEPRVVVVDGDAHSSQDIAELRMVAPDSVILALVSPRNSRRCLLAGADEVLLRPFATSELLSRVTQLEPLIARAV
jgi:hypothetical protein